MKNILVTGGAGYIGSHTIRALQKADYNIIIFDNLSSGHKKAVKGYRLIVEDLADQSALMNVFKENKIDAVIHFAGSIEAGESMTDPRRFLKNNITNSINLINVMMDYNVKKIVFSSSAAVYGEPEKMPVTEDALKNPTNVYGSTKKMFEEMLAAYDYAYGLKSVSLRYFNAAGADPSGDIGADHKHKTHLITLIILTALGQRDAIKIFGTNYSTPDGTCIRDYIHVNDLADAHVLAANHLFNNGSSVAYNLGNEKGTSVKEVIDAAKKITKIDFKVIEKGRRDGDPAKLVASSKKIQQELGWKPKFEEIEKIIETAWNWHKKHPNGFNK